MNVTDGTTTYITKPRKKEMLYSMPILVNKEMFTYREDRKKSFIQTKNTSKPF